jgi:uncharacterized protein (DUF736 family)
MASIEHVTANAKGDFKGRLRTLSLTAEVEIVPNDNNVHDNQPDYRVLSGGIDVGPGWNCRSEASNWQVTGRRQVMAGDGKIKRKSARRRFLSMSLSAHRFFGRLSVSAAPRKRD